MNTQTKTQKEIYEAPMVVVYGNVAQITQTGGGNFTDVPDGTPIGPDGIDGVTGNPPMS